MGKQNNFFEVVLLLLLFLLIIMIAYYFTYAIARVQKGIRSNKNLEIIEVINLGQSKYLELVRIGNQYVVISVAKQHVETVLTLKAEDLDLNDDVQNAKMLPFQQILDRYKNGKIKKEVEGGRDDDETKNK